MKVFKIASLLTIILMLSIGTLSAQETTDPQPLTWDGLRVIDMIETDLLTGPANSNSYLAPNGEIFAHLAGGSTLCIYDATTLDEQRCFDLRDEIQLILDQSNVVWSPDSRYIAGHNDFLRMFRQPDIHIFDVETGEITILNPDEPFTISDEDWGMIDIVPRWIDAERLAFLRYTRDVLPDGSVVPPLLMVYNLEDGSLEEAGVLSVGTGNPYAIYKFDISSDGQTIVHNFYMGGRGEANNGAWISNIDGTNPQHIWHDNEVPPPHMVNFSPDASYVMVYINDGTVFSHQPPQSPFQILDIEARSMRLIDPDNLVTGAAWSPDGSLLAYIVRNTLINEANGLYVTDEIGKTGQRVLEGDFYLPVNFQPQPLVWSANNHIILGQVESNTGLIVQLGNE